MIDLIHKPPKVALLCITSLHWRDILGLNAGVPGGFVGGPRAYQDQFRGFKSHQVHACKGFFLHERN